MTKIVKKQQFYQNIPKNYLNKPKMAYSRDAFIRD